MGRGRWNDDLARWAPVAPAPRLGASGMAPSLPNHGEARRAGGGSRLWQIRERVAATEAFIQCLA
jgi:hypothetical protein